MLNFRGIESFKRHDLKLFRIRVLALTKCVCFASQLASQPDHGAEQCYCGVNPVIDQSNNVTAGQGRMDRELLKQSLAYHGEPLLSKLKCEQTENPDFQAVVSDLSKATYERYVGL